MDPDDANIKARLEEVHPANTLPAWRTILVAMSYLLGKRRKAGS